MSPAAIQRLSRSAGNRAVSAMLTRPGSVASSSAKVANGAGSSEGVVTSTSASDTAEFAGVAAARLGSIGTSFDAPMPPDGPDVHVQRYAGIAKSGSFSPPKPPTPPKPKSDPRFVKVVGQVKQATKETKKHPPAKAEAKQAQDAAVAPTNDRDAQAKAAQADKLAGAKTSSFDKAAFIAAMTSALTKIKPKNLEESDDLASSGKADEVKSQVVGKVADGKKAASQDMDAKAKEPPDPSVAKEKPVTPLKPAPDPKVAAPAFGEAAPPKAPPEQTNLDGAKNETDAKMAQADVSEADLKKSNEPEMVKAVDAKKEGEEHSAKAPAEVRKAEDATVKQAQGGMSKEGKSDLAAMVAKKKGTLGKIGSTKSDTKAKDEAKRAEVTGKVNSIFDATKLATEGILKDLDTTVKTEFDSGEAEAKQAFTSTHQTAMRRYKNDRYGGFGGGLLWAKDKLVGMPDEVNAFYEAAKAIYISKMTKLAHRLADIVDRELTRARQRVQTGREQIKSYVASLPKDLQKVGGDAAKSVEEKFESLESDVDNKGASLQDELATKYTEAMEKVNADIEAMQAENKGLWDSIKDAIGGAIQAILKLKDLFMGILSKAAGAFKKIVADPLKFIGNFMTAVKTGFMSFATNILDHLKKGLQGWLFGKLGEAGIEIPDKFDLQGIIKMVLSILGLTWQNIRGKLVKKIGEKAMQVLETTSEVFVILVKEGIGGLWKWIVQKVGDLKAMVMDQIRNFVIEKIVKAGITWVIGMLNPAGALIKIIQTLISVIQWIMEKGQALVELVSTVVDSISDIANGGMGGVPAKIEGALSKAVPIVISFLASLLGLGGIGEKVKSIIEAVQKPVMSAVDTVIKGALKVAGPLINAVKKGSAWTKKKIDQAKDFAKKKYEAGKQFVKDKASAAKDWANEKLGRRTKSFSMDGHGHDLIFEPGPPARMLMASATPIDIYLAVSGLLLKLQQNERNVDTTGMAPDDAEKAQKAAKDRRLAEVQALYPLERQASNLVNMSTDVALHKLPQAQLDAAMAAFSAALSAYADKYKRGGFTGKDAQVASKVPGLYEGVPTGATHAGWRFVDHFDFSLRGECSVITEVHDPKGNSGGFERFYQPWDKQFGLKNAFLRGLDPMIPAEVALGSRGIPTQMFVTQRQMKIFEEAAAGQFPPTMAPDMRAKWMKALAGKLGGGLAAEAKELKWSTIQNRLTVIELNGRKGENRDKVILETPSYSYALSTLTQSGMMIVPGSVHVEGGHEGFTLGMLPGGDKAKEEKAMNKWGIKLSDSVFSDFNIKAKVVPIT